MDVIDNCIGVWQQINHSNGWFDELFYTTGDMPEIVIKQAHVIKKFLELVQQLENIGDDLNELFSDDREENEEVDFVSDESSEEGSSPTMEWDVTKTDDDQPSLFEGESEEEK
jgi:hypothetical protein